MTKTRRCDFLSSRASRNRRRLRKKHERPNNHKIYNISNRSVKKAQKKKGLGLIDGGANGGLRSLDMRILDETDRKVHVTGITSHQIPDKRIVCCAAVSPDSTGQEILCIYPEYADTPEQKTSIHSCTQLCAHKVEVHDMSILAGGKQCIIMS